MRNIRAFGIAGIALGIAATCVGTMAQQPQKPPLPEEARKRLDYSIGKWHSETHYLNGDGTVRSTVHYEDERRFLIDDRVVHIVGARVDGSSTFTAWEYYDVQAGKYTMTSVDSNGALWTLTGDLGEEFVWTGSREGRDGRSMSMRFTHFDFKKDSFTALGEISRDGGKTWTAFARQHLTRIDE